MIMLLVPVHPFEVVDVAVYVVVAEGQAFGLNTVVELSPLPGDQLQFWAGGLLVAVSWAHCPLQMVLPGIEELMVTNGSGFTLMVTIAVLVQFWAV